MSDAVTSSPDWFEIALGVLPALPRQVVLLRENGAPITATLFAAQDGALHAQLTVVDATKDLEVTIPVESGERGGYSIVCRIEEVFFLGSVDASMRLAVLEVRRRKPYRVKERVAVDAEATLTVLHAAEHAEESMLFGRVIDISASGAGITTTTNDLVIGDRLRFQAAVAGVLVNAEVVVRSVGRGSFGRSRVGCQFAALPAGVETRLDELAAG